MIANNTRAAIGGNPKPPKVIAMCSMSWRTASLVAAVRGAVGHGATPLLDGFHTLQILHEVVKLM